MIHDLAVENPKRNGKHDAGRSAWYPYYAGFSYTFASALLSSANLPPTAVVADPWNGTGTTTTASVFLGYATAGFDLNPAMVVVSKARLINDQDLQGVPTLARTIVTRCGSASNALCPEDPLTIWFQPSAAVCIRSLEQSLRLRFLPASNAGAFTREEIHELSRLGALFYLALFRTVRSLLRPFIPSNPTWTKKPKSSSNRLSVAPSDLYRHFEREVNLLAQSSRSRIPEGAVAQSKPTLEVAASESIPLPSQSIDCVITSPPYCTRIDYAVATLPELAVLGLRLDDEFATLRRSLIGTATVPPEVLDPPAAWGPTCNSFLATLREHSSKASRTYYWKNHVAYFAGLYPSIAEIARTLRQSGFCAIVVQDSYYKNIHNDLASIIIEMSESVGLELVRRVDFHNAQNLGRINAASRNYRSNFMATESVLLLTAVGSGASK